jgi:hypothetical protein
MAWRIGGTWGRASLSKHFEDVQLERDDLSLGLPISRHWNEQRRDSRKICFRGLEQMMILPFTKAAHYLPGGLKSPLPAWQAPLPEKGSAWWPSTRSCSLGAGPSWNATVPSWAGGAVEMGSPCRTLSLPRVQPPPPPNSHRGGKKPRKTGAHIVWSSESKTLKLLDQVHLEG